MPTEQDFQLAPRDDACSDVICNLCESTVGEVDVAQQTPTGRQTGRTEAQVTVEARQMMDEHLASCPRAEQAADPSETSNETSNRPPSTAPLDKQRD